jgi:hypothetical protein
MLRMAYRIDAYALPKADLVVSAGGETQMPNICVARYLGVPSIFCGSLLRGLGPENFSLIISSYDRDATSPRHMVVLKPAAIDPDALGRPKIVPRYGPALAKDPGVVSRFIDYRTAGPGTLPQVFSEAEVIVSTEDSSTMISEAVSARLPVVGAAPSAHRFTDEEQEYRDFLIRNNWCRVVPIAALTPDAFGRALSETEPLQENPLDALAAKLKQRLPQLFADSD